ncbi:MAG TPA: hypothetical protein VGO43_11015, partial [Pyrinomonadaceae bacterium]|nr:hypothetical protein [Pyrinomonadaceae bacterium]
QRRTSDLARCRFIEIYFRSASIRGTRSSTLRTTEFEEQRSGKRDIRPTVPIADFQPMNSRILELPG